MNGGLRVSHAHKTGMPGQPFLCSGLYESRPNSKPGRTGSAASLFPKTGFLSERARSPCTDDLLLEVFCSNSTATSQPVSKSISLCTQEAIRGPRPCRTILQRMLSSSPLMLMAEAMSCTTSQRTGRAGAKRSPCVLLETFARLVVPD